MIINSFFYIKTDSFSRKVNHFLDFTVIIAAIVLFSTDLNTLYNCGESEKE